MSWLNTLLWTMHLRSLPFTYPQFLSPSLFLSPKKKEEKTQLKTSPILVPSSSVHSSSGREKSPSSPDANSKGTSVTKMHKSVLLRDTLSTYEGYSSFMQSLIAEHSSENLLFITEVLQWRTYLLEKEPNASTSEDAEKEKWAFISKLQIPMSKLPSSPSLNPSLTPFGSLFLSFSFTTPLVHLLMRPLAPTKNTLVAGVPLAGVYL